MSVIQIPYSPRPLQREAHNNPARFKLLVCHRRFGKTVFAVNELIKAACTSTKENPRFAYIAPLYRQAKSVAWDMVKTFSRPIPGIKYNEAELRADFPNGSRISLYGGDSPDTLRGIYLDDCVMDEYAQMSERLWPEVIRPALADRKGGAIFIGTPMGHNAFYDMYQDVKDDADWYVRLHKASETEYVEQEELDAAKKAMSEEQYRQEFECSWQAAVMGSYYGRLLEEAETESRIGKVAHDTALEVETWWDLGIGDSTAIWFAQRVGTEVRLIDYYENSGEPLSHYTQLLDDKRQGGYQYSHHVFPHDVKARSLDTGKTRVQTLQTLGIEPHVMAADRVEDGIEAVRRMLKNCWFDELRCKRGLDALRQYRAEYDDKNRTFRLKPKHDWASHAADSFRYGAMFKAPKISWQPLEYGEQGIV